MHPPAAAPALAALSLLLLAACKEEAAPVAKAERPVQVVRVAFAPEHPSRDFVGIVRARTEADLGFRVAGKIVDRPVNVGDRVAAGDVVARLDPQDLQLQVESAEAELAAATSNLTQAAAEEERYAGLKARGYAAVADYDRRKAARDEADGRLQRARRTLELARNQLAYAELKADSDGVITAASAEPGQVVAIGQAVVRLARRGDKEAVVALPETWLAEAGKATARVALWSAPGRSFTAHLRELSPQADPATRTYAARFTIADADDTVALGMTATVTLSPGGEARMARLPLSAVINRGSGPAVYVVESSGALVLSPVTVASFSEDTARITGGLREGDRVVTLGVQKLEAGEKVRTVDLR
jgi:RND family efflux transporter MFP subunit